MKAIQRVIGTFSVMGEKRIPFAAVVVAKSESGERVIPGVKSFVDSLPEIPLGRFTGNGEWMAYSRTEREAMAAEDKSKADRASKKEAKQAAYDALPIVERAKIEAKKREEKEKRAAKKGAPPPSRPPHSFVQVIRPLDRFIPPPALDKPMVPPPVSPTLEAEATAKLETDADRQARKDRLEAYKSKVRPAWLQESNSQRKGT